MGRKSSKLLVGMDVHKESIDIAVAEEAGEVRHQGRIGGELNALARTVRSLESLGRVRDWIKTDRRALVEAAWAYRTAPAVSPIIARQVKPL